MQTFTTASLDKTIATIHSGCKTRIALIFKNIFKTAILSCYILVKTLELLNKQPPCLIKIFLKLHII